MTFWDTDIPPWSLDWDAAPDNALMLSLFKAIEDKTFGLLDPGHLYAAGISSGGYMTRYQDPAHRGPSGQSSVDYRSPRCRC